MRTIAGWSRRERDAVALALPVVAVGLTYATWPLLAPSPWFFFFPAVFVAAWIGSAPAAFTATVGSAVVAYFCFTAPRYTWIAGHPADLGMAGLFAALGGCFVVLFDRLRAHQARTSAAESALLRAAERERIAREVHDLVIQRMFALGLRLDAARGRGGGAWDAELEVLRGEIDELIHTIRVTIFQPAGAEPGLGDA